MRPTTPPATHTILMLAKDLDIGGMETYIKVLSTQLLHHGHTVIAQTAGGALVTPLTQDGLQHYFLSVDYHLPRLRTLQIDPRAIDLAFSLENLINFLFLPYSLVRTIQISLKHHVTLLHAHSSLCALLGLVTAKILRIPLVITLHNFRGPFVNAKFVFQQADQIIVISPELRDKLRDQGVNPHKLVVLPNMIEMNPTVHELPSDIVGVRQDSFKILTVSRLDPHKSDVAKYLILGVENLIRDHPDKDIQLVIVGGGSEFGQLQKLADTANQKFGKPTVILTGSRIDAISLLSTADIVVGAGRVVLEAMAVRKPVIVASSRFSGLIDKNTVTQIAQYNFSGRDSTDKTTQNNLYHAITFLLQNPHLQETAAQFSYEYAKQHYSAEECVKRIEQIYTHLVSHVCRHR